jgi:hypothetical protein
MHPAAASRPKLEALMQQLHQANELRMRSKFIPASVAEAIGNAEPLKK